MSEPSADFAALLERGRQGDPAALAELVRQYEPKVRLVARVLLGSALRPYLDSVDLVQSVHHSLLLGLRQTRFSIATPDALMALALTVLRRKVARQWRRAQRQRRLDGETASAGPLPLMLAGLSAPQSDPAAAAQLHDQMAHLCASLSDAERRILEMRLQGYSNTEIAQEVGLNDIALRVRWTRLRQRLRDSGVLDDCL